MRPARLLVFRGLRRSDREVPEADAQPLLAVKGHPDPAGPTIGEIADYLVLRHHSAVELIDRAADDGLVKRNPDADSKSVVRVTLTPAGSAKLDALVETHLQELAHLAPTMRTLWKALEQADGDTPPPSRSAERESVLQLVEPPAGAPHRQPSDIAKRPHPPMPPSRATPW